MAFKSGVNNILEGDGKASIRNKVWGYLEETNIAMSPRPVYHRIPNFKGAADACNRLTSLDVYRKALIVQVNPDKPLEQARYCILETHKQLLVPTPRLRSGLFNRITPPADGGGKNALKVCASSQGVREHSMPIGLQSKVKIDLVILGAVAVSPSGLRIGKGEGFADLEYAMMLSMGAVDEHTPVIAVVHDCQVLDLSEDLCGEHDVPVDYIVTPTDIIKCPQRPKPTGVIWSKLSKEKYEQIPVLKQLRRKEKLIGKDVTLSFPAPTGECCADLHLKRCVSASDKTGCVVSGHDVGTDEIASGMAEDGTTSDTNRSLTGCTSDNTNSNTSARSFDVKVRHEKSDARSTHQVYIGGMSKGSRASELKAAVRQKGVNPVSVTWKTSYAFLTFADVHSMETALDSLSALELNSKKLKVEKRASQD